MLKKYVNIQKENIMNLKEIVISSLPKEEIYEPLINLVAETIDDTKGDYCVPCFSLSKELKKSPILIADELKSKLLENELIEKIESVAGYVNFYLNKKLVSKMIIDEILDKQLDYFKSDIGKGKTICIDYSSVNLAKYMHIGHLKNTIIGESIARICENLGYKVIRINYIGDYGTPFGKIIVGYKLWGNKQDVEERGIDALQEYYVKFNQESQNDENLEDMARETFKKIELKDDEIYPIYQWIVEIAIKEAKRLLDILGVKFDSWRGESHYSGQLNQVVNFLTEKGLVKESEGALVVDLSQFDMPPCLIRRTDGASLYATRDIAAAIDRYNNYHFDKMFYVTGHEQQLHFKQIFKVLELSGQPFAKNLEHIHYGLFSLPTGKISSRKGKQATLVDLMDYSFNKAKSVIENRTFNYEKPEDVAQKVARGALNFSALKVEVGKDCVFDIDRAFSFDGETAPYMQYSYTRIESILRKVDIDKNIVPDYSCINNEIGFELIKNCNDIKNVILQAFNKREPSMIVKKSMDICKALNKFYTTTKVLEGTENEILAKVNLLKIIKLTLQTTFNLMCIDTLLEM